MPTIGQPTDRKSVTLPTSLWADIGAYRFYNHIPTEAEAIRQLLVRGLGAKNIVAIFSRRIKHIPGPFGLAERNAFVLMDRMTALLQQDYRLPAPDARRRAEAAIENVLQACGADIDMACDMLNADWRLWLQ